jgi:hypothetical protein
MQQKRVKIEELGKMIADEVSMSNWLKKSQ